MNYLITLHTKPVGTEINSVNARELHNFLGARKVYANWIKDRIAKYGFVENQDYIIVQTKRAGNNATLKEYYITLDMAKELSMVENNEKGREARQWFIEIAKQYTATPTQLDLITPYEVRRDLATARRKLTLEKKKHRATAELYEQARKERDHLKTKMKQQLKLIVSGIVANTERDILNLFEESLEVNVRAIKLPYKER